MAHPYWPLFDLVVRSPRLELRLAREEEFIEMVDLIDAGIHDPATMPFSIPWTDAPLPQRQRDSYQWWWGRRAAWRPEDWTFDATVFLDGTIIGAQSIAAKQFATLRGVSSGSWLGQAYQGKGYGKEMRSAMLHLAFEGLGAVVAYSGAFFDNAASLATSRSLGYRENGRQRELRRGEAAEIINLRLDRDDWFSSERPPCTIDGLGGCRDMFGAVAPE
jgi:RimJ/RimL family protein N-acetyltransferase